MIYECAMVYSDFGFRMCVVYESFDIDSDFGFRKPLVGFSLWWFLKLSLLLGFRIPDFGNRLWGAVFVSGKPWFQISDFGNLFVVVPLWWFLYHSDFGYRKPFFFLTATYFWCFFIFSDSLRFQKRMVIAINFWWYHKYKFNFQIHSDFGNA